MSKLSDFDSERTELDAGRGDILRQLVEQRGAQFAAEIQSKDLVAGATGRLLDDIKRIVRSFVQPTDVADYIAFMIGAAVVHEVGVHRVTRMFNHIQPDASLGRGRRKQVQAFAKKGAAARRQYTDADRDRWRQLRAEHYARHSARRAAEFIVKAEGLPASAVESVRQALLKKAVTPPLI